MKIFKYCLFALFIGSTFSFEGSCNSDDDCSADEPYADSASERSGGGGGGGEDGGSSQPAQEVKCPYCGAPQIQIPAAPESQSPTCSSCKRQLAP